MVIEIGTVCKGLPSLDEIAAAPMIGKTVVVVERPAFRITSRQDVVWFRDVDEEGGFVWYCQPHMLEPMEGPW